MNYQNYDEYMRNLMGYPSMGVMGTTMNPNMSQSMCPYSNMETYSDDIERMYPEVYRVVYPMVCFACDNVRTNVTEDMVDMMTDDIYDRVEADGRINIDMTFDDRNVESNSENRQRRPRRRNRFLRDLIRILLLRELLGRRRRLTFV